LAKTNKEPLYEGQPINQVDEAPWNKDQQLPPSSKGSHNYIEPVMFPSSHTAPYATFDNQIAPEVLFPYYSSPNSSTYHYMMLL
jgi:hypothetical protein